MYLIREDDGKGIKSLRDIYKETRVRVTCYMACLENKWIKAAWRRQNTKEENSIEEEAMKTMEDVEVEIQFEEGIIWIDGELIEERWKPAWKKLKEKLKKGMKKQRIDRYQRKEQKSKLYKEQEQECHVWPSQNLNPGKTAAVMTMLEQMVETRSWKEARGLMDDGRCQLCNQHLEMVEHLAAGCTKLANSK